MNTQPSRVVDDYDTTIFASSHGFVSAIDISTSYEPRIIWQKKCNKKWYSANVSELTSLIFLDEDKNLYAGGRNHIYKMDSYDGKRLWRSTRIGVGKTKSPPNFILMDDRIILAYCYTLYGINKQTGSIDWQVPLPEACIGPPALTRSKDTIFVTSHGKLMAYSPTNGELLWKDKFSRTTNKVSSIAYSQSKKHPYVFVSATDKVVVYDVRLQKKIHTRKIRSRAVHSLLCNKDNVYVGTHEKIFAFSVKNFAMLWTHPFDSKGDTIALAAAHVKEEDIIFASHYYGEHKIALLSLRASTGRTRWQRYLARVHERCVGSATIIVHGNIICVGSSNGTAIFLDPVLKGDTGKRRIGLSWLSYASTLGVTDTNAQPVVQEFFLNRSKQTN